MRERVPTPANDEFEVRANTDVDDSGSDSGILADDRGRRAASQTDIELDISIYIVEFMFIAGHCAGRERSCPGTAGRGCAARSWFARVQCAGRRIDQGRPCYRSRRNRRCRVHRRRGTVRDRPGWWRADRRSPQHRAFRDGGTEPEPTAAAEPDNAAAQLSAAVQMAIEVPTAKPHRSSMPPHSRRSRWRVRHGDTGAPPARRHGRYCAGGARRGTARSAARRSGLVGRWSTNSNCASVLRRACWLPPAGSWVVRGRAARRRIGALHSGCRLPAATIFCSRTTPPAFSPNGHEQGESTNGSACRAGINP